MDFIIYFNFNVLVNFMTGLFAYLQYRKKDEYQILPSRPSTPPLYSTHEVCTNVNFVLQVLFFYTSTIYVLLLKYYIPMLE